MRLCNKTLSDLPDTILKPNYDRKKLSPGIIHIGLGNFHRAHQAWYIHRLMQEGLAGDWAIIGAGVLPKDEEQRKRLSSQDYLTTLIELDPKGVSAEVIGSIVGFVPVQENNADLIKKMADPSIRIVSLTITEGGYFTNSAVGSFNESHPDIQHDKINPEKPRTAFGAIVAALKSRKEKGIRPFTCMSCDNLQSNGNILKNTVLYFARNVEPELANWIEKRVSFPNSMVDCIVPATGDKEYALADSLNIEDRAPVTHENFRQWVIEDNFCAGRPDLKKVGVTFVKDVHYHEKMKIRLLNGGHQIIANAGELLSVPTISECMRHPKIGPLLSKILYEEISPYVQSVPEIDAIDYINLITDRFSNEMILDTTRRVAFDGSSRHPGFLVPSILDALEAKSNISGLALAEALWARMCAGKREDGSIIEPNDPKWIDLQRTAIKAKDEPRVWLAQEELYGKLGSNERFLNTFSNWVKVIWTYGVEAAIDKYLTDV